MKRIMVVDDDEDIVELISDALSFAGYTVETALNGEECLRKIESFGPDLILLDIMMPGMDGWTVLEELKGRGHCETTNIAMLTAKYLSENDTARDTFDDLVHYIHKPISIQGLVQEVENIFLEETHVAEERQKISSALGKRFAGRYEKAISESMRKQRILSNLLITNISSDLVKAPDDVEALIQSVNHIEKELRSIKHFFSPLVHFFSFGIENELNRIKGILTSLLDDSKHG